MQDTQSLLQKKLRPHRLNTFFGHARRRTQPHQPLTNRTGMPLRRRYIYISPIITASMRDAQLLPGRSEECTLPHRVCCVWRGASQPPSTHPCSSPAICIPSPLSAQPARLQRGGRNGMKRTTARLQPPCLHSAPCPLGSGGRERRESGCTASPSQRMCCPWRDACFSLLCTQHRTQLLRHAPLSPARSPSPQPPRTHAAPLLPAPPHPAPPGPPLHPSLSPAVALPLSARLSSTLRPCSGLEHAPSRAAHTGLCSVRPC